MNKIRTSILNFVFSKGFVRRRNLWYMVFVTPLVLFVTQIEAKRLDKVTQLALRRRFTYSQYNAQDHVYTPEEYQILDHKVKMNIPK